MNANSNNPGASAQEPLSKFEQDLLDLDASLSALRGDPTWSLNDLADSYFKLTSLKSDLSILVKQIETILIERMAETDAVPVSSGEMVVKEWSKNRKGWQHKELAVAVSEKIQMLSVDMDTGERIMDTAQMIQAMLDYVQPSYWRVGALSNIGLNADDYCQAGDAEPKIRIEKTK